MKRLLMLALLGGAILTASGCCGGIDMLNFGKCPPAPKPSEVGRYQLEVSEESGTLYKVDTVTGEVWSYDRGKWEKR